MDNVDNVDCVVVGAGVVGLAVARALALDGREVVILEREDTFGTQTSSRNSEVIHAGIYYPQGSLKARLCVRGRELLYDYCHRRGVPHRRCGKLIVATDDGQTAHLERIADAAARNGVNDLRYLEGGEARRLEPALRASAALLSPSTGIVDSHALMLALLGEAEAHGALLSCRAPVTGLHWTPDGVEVAVDDDPEPLLRADLVVNAAGLAAPAVAGAIRDFPSGTIPTAYYARGCYFTMSARAPFHRLIYPVPDEQSLGVHLTLDLAGRARFGPDVEWIDSPEYQVGPHRADGFYDAIRRYWPGLGDGALSPDYAGVRPKIAGPGEPGADFRISGPEEHGRDGIINLFGIESPGLTSALAIAEEVTSRAR